MLLPQVGLGGISTEVEVAADGSFSPPLTVRAVHHGRGHIALSGFRSDSFVHAEVFFLEPQAAAAAPCLGVLWNGLDSFSLFSRIC